VISKDITGIFFSVFPKNFSENEKENPLCAKKPSVSSYINGIRAAEISVPVTAVTAENPFPTGIFSLSIKP
jgi:hypothetical protein